jgi:hypothetical protein
VVVGAADGQVLHAVLEAPLLCGVGGDLREHEAPAQLRGRAWWRPNLRAREARPAGGVRRLPPRAPAGLVRLPPPAGSPQRRVAAAPGCRPAGHGSTAVGAWRRVAAGIAGGAGLSSARALHCAFTCCVTSRAQWSRLPAGSTLEGS